MVLDELQLLIDQTKSKISLLSADIARRTTIETNPIALKQQLQFEQSTLSSLLSQQTQEDTNIGDQDTQIQLPTSNNSLRNIIIIGFVIIGSSLLLSRGNK